MTIQGNLAVCCRGSEPQVLERFTRCCALLERSMTLAFRTMTIRIGLWISVGWTPQPLRALSVRSGRGAFPPVVPHTRTTRSFVNIARQLSNQDTTRGASLVGAAVG